MGSLRSQSWGSLRSPQESGGFPKTCKFSTDCGRAAAFFSFETDKSRPPFLEALRDK